jgi:hypothetical protein
MGFLVLLFIKGNTQTGYPNGGMAGCTFKTWPVYFWQKNRI